MIHKKLFKGISLKNPLQPITRAAGNAVGLNASLKGVKVDPGRLLTTAMAATGNPAAIAALAGNWMSAAAPGSGIGRLGNTVGKVGGLAAGLTGGGAALAGKIGGALRAIPGAGGAASGLGSLAGKIGGVIPKPLASAAGLLRGGVGSGPVPLPNVDMTGLNNAAIQAAERGVGSPSWLTQAASASGGAPSLLRQALSSLVGGSGGGSGGAPGGINLGRLLGTGLTVAGGIGGIKDSAAAEKQRNALVGRQTALADQLAQQGGELFAGARPMREAAQSALLSRIQQGPQAFVDRNNPFSANFAASPAPSPAIPRPDAALGSGVPAAIPWWRGVA